MNTLVTCTVAIAIASLCLPGCGDQPALPETATMGPNPQLVEPKPEYLPAIDIAPARGWPAGGYPKAAAALSVAAFATDLDHPRWIYVLPNGDVLVAETNKPEGSGGRSGITGWIMGLIMKSAGAGVKSPDRITLLRDADGDGKVEVKSTFLTGLHSPFGMALVGSDLYVANTNAIVRFPYTDGQTEIKEQGTKVTDLPALPLNHHWTKNILATTDGKKLMATVGSNSNVAENGMDKEERRAAILEVDLASGDSRIFASGLRNPNGLAWHPETGELWTVVNERDEIGPDLVPDYLTSVKNGAFYGWPYSYFGQHVDTRVDPQRPDLVATAIVPDYALGAHTASLGLTFYSGTLLPEKYRNGAFIGQHGSWNREPKSGYKVIFVPFEGGRPTGSLPETILSGFLNSEGEALGRPVGIAVDRAGALLVADDVGNTIWRVTPALSPSAEAAP